MTKKKHITDWYETEIQPVIGTSLFIEVEFSSDCSSEIEHETNKNAFMNIEQIEGDNQNFVESPFTRLSETGGSMPSDSVWSPVYPNSRPNKIDSNLER